MRAMKRIMGKGAYKSGRVRQAAHDGNREFITLLACISAIGKKIPASLLYTGESYDLQNTWVQDLEDDDDFFFGASSNGWTCDAYGLKWLTDVFEPATRPTSPRTKRLLIVDGHSSHVNMAFINKCWELRIILLIFPPHSTHRLQPLDVVLFGLLSLAYHKELNAFNVRGLGMVPMKKKNFLKLFRPAWRISFTEENILKAFAKPGIWPYDPALVLNVITRPITPPPAIQPAPSSIDRLKTPRSAKSIRHFQADYRKNPTRAKLEKLFKANEELAAQAALDRWTTVGLIEALKDEKKSRARGKRLNVLGEEHTGPILFSAENVRRAQERFAEKEAFEKSERIRIDTKKAETAAKKQKAEVENAEKALQAAAREDNIEQVRVEEKAEKQAQKKKEAAQIKALKALPVRIKAPTKARKAPVVKKKVVRFVGGDIEGQGVETPAKQSSRGRAIKPRVIFESGSNQ
ncbi:DDE-domain-containing protein [Hyaloscypha variabilis F]|uniref:DDE-domain-containing protein n=1 Tax=Hyaloscypha variabilis (strain UAMH 11265 / GT02V1 / F) TaxID=1149755 RepID=A0A2J6R882_HYAVF|nr:DDE-domain-containing protein [Hyaloscypha variabilis F]